MEQTGRLKYISSYASVLVRLCDEQRMGHLQHAAWSGSAKPYLRLPPYVRETPRVEAELKKTKEASRTYDNARWLLLALFFQMWKAQSTLSVAESTVSWQTHQHGR